MSQGKDLPEHARRCISVISAFQGATELVGAFPLVGESDIQKLESNARIIQSANELS